jgi:hypothetical protein
MLEEPEEEQLDIQATEGLVRMGITTQTVPVALAVAEAEAVVRIRIALAVAE